MVVLEAEVTPGNVLYSASEGLIVETGVRDGPVKTFLARASRLY